MSDTRLFTINSETVQYVTQLEGDVKETEEIIAKLINKACGEGRFDYAIKERKVLYDWTTGKSYTIFSILANKV